MNSMNRFSIVLCLACAVLGACGVACADNAEPSQNSGVWQKHSMRFTFLGFTATYSCDGLADKLKRLLIVAGARQDAKASPSCIIPFGRPEKLASADLTFYTLASSATAAKSSEATSTANAASAADSNSTLIGTWRAVQFAARSPRELELGDCELIEQFRDRVLPLLTTRNIKDHTNCIPYQLSGSNFDLRFEAFVPFPDKPTGGQDTHRTALNGNSQPWQ